MAEKINILIIAPDNIVVIIPYHKAFVSTPLNLLKPVPKIFLNSEFLDRTAINNTSTRKVIINNIIKCETRKCIVKDKTIRLKNPVINRA